MIFEDSSSNNEDSIERFEQQIDQFLDCICRVCSQQDSFDAILELCLTLSKQVNQKSSLNSSAFPVHARPCLPASLSSSPTAIDVSLILHFPPWTFPPNPAVKQYHGTARKKERKSRKLNLESPSRKPPWK